MPSSITSLTEGTAHLYQKGQSIMPLSSRKFYGFFPPEAAMYMIIASRPLILAKMQDVYVTSDLEEAGGMNATHLFGILLAQECNKSSSDT